MKNIVAVIAVLNCLLSLCAETRTWSGAGENAFLANPANWQGDVAPSVSGDKLVFPTADATRAENDRTGFAANGIVLTGGAYVLGGLPWTLAGNLAVEAGAGAVQTFDADLLFSGWSRTVDVPDGHTVVFNGIVGHAATTGCSVHLNGEGTKILRGGMKIADTTDTDNDAQGKASRLQYGTLIIEGDIDIPRYIMGHDQASGSPAHVVVTNGATVRNWKQGMNTFIQNCTLDISSGRFVNDGSLLVAQGLNTHTRINVLRHGVFATGTNSRIGNNGTAELTVEEGGIFYWQGGSFSENGRTILNLKGGRLVRGGTGTDQLGIGQRPANDSSYHDIGGNVINLDGGEIWVGSISNNSDVNRNKGTVTTVNCNGGTFMCGVSVANFWSGELGSLEVKALAGGIRMDTRSCNVGWNVTSAGEGGFVKCGVGKLTISAQQTFAGALDVRAGEVVLADPSFVTQRVVLSPGAIFTPGGRGGSLAALVARDGILRLTCAADETALTLAAAPEAEGTLFFDLQNDAGETLATPGVYPLLAAPELSDDLAARCQVLNPPSGSAATFAVADGVLTVTVAASEEAAAGAVSSSWTAAAGGELVRRRAGRPQRRGDAGRRGRGARHAGAGRDGGIAGVLRHAVLHACGRGDADLRQFDRLCGRQGPGRHAGNRRAGGRRGSAAHHDVGRRARGLLGEHGWRAGRPGHRRHRGVARSFDAAEVPARGRRLRIHGNGRGRGGRGDPAEREWHDPPDCGGGADDPEARTLPLAGGHTAPSGQRRRRRFAGWRGLEPVVAQRPPALAGRRRLPLPAGAAHGVEP
ncbi:MAG: hypothetical protein ACI4Q3_05965 [Kiritimatiellia bacterium]